ncbi:ABC transporter ATP-binding protein [Leucobacter sp. CSA2]|uniref:ABC transporter ATP-binding protein n=1 Tax=Leucobacter edaphi TaxID=2796472 RepID=A0A934QDL5_9MICO|nr:ABC transporter ATP-binding protein [Leucobacter edaphi]MBK0421302.1 ABC transporter ATP-binding protein [Leucobacter edaphi]
MSVNAVSVGVDDALLLPATTFQAGPGQIVALRGENGSGKTTLLRVLTGRARPTAGTVQVCGGPVNERDPAFRRRVATMIGLPPMASDLTVFDHVALVSSTWEQDPGSVESAARSVLTEFDLVALSTRYPHELSSGQTQLFGLALAFVRPFDVLLLDEPEQRLDPERTELLARAMLDRRASGATIVAATHSDRLADRTADRTLTLEARS